MHYVQYAGPSDTFDVSNLLGKPGMVFHTPTNSAVPADLRGTVLQVTNEAWEELQTYPNHRFVEVAEGQAKDLIARQTTARSNREQQEQTLVAANPTIPLIDIQRQLGVFPATVEVAPSAARPAAEIKAETRAEAKAIADATPAVVKE